MRLIQLTPADADRIVELERTAFITPLRVSRRAVLERFERGHRMFGIESRDQLCALLCMYFDAFGSRLPEGFPSTLEELVARPSVEAFDSAVLYNLAVVPQFRDGRAAKRLVTAALDLAKQEGCSQAVANCRMPSYGSEGEDFRGSIDDFLATGRLPMLEEFLVDPTLAFYHRLTGCRFAGILPGFAPQDLASGGMRALACGDLADWRTPGSPAGLAGEDPAMSVENLEPRILLSATWVDADTGGALDGATEGGDEFTGTSADDMASGLAGDDEMWGQGGADELFGGDGADVLHGGAGSDVLSGDAGADTIYGDGGADQLSGGAGNDTIDGGEGADTVEGGEGDDLLRGQGGSDALAGGDGHDTLLGGGGADTLVGGAGADVLHGGYGNDVMFAAGGGLGDDDAIIGGVGYDTVDYSGADAAVEVDLTEGTATGGGGTDTLSGVEAVVATEHDDTFSFDSPQDGAVFSVDGAGGSNSVDLGGFERGDVSFEYERMTIDLPDGGSFTVAFENIDTIEFGDKTVNLVTWDGDAASDDVSDGLNWSSDTVPGPDDILVFDGTVDSSAVLDADVDRIGGLLVADGYTGTITIDHPLEIAGDVELGSGHLNAGSHAVAVGGDLRVNGGSFSADALVANGDVMVTTGSFDVDALTIGGAGDSVLQLSAQELDELVIDKSGGTLTLGGEITITGDLMHVAGVVEGGDSTVEFQGRNMTIAAGDITFNDVVIENGGTITLEGNLDVDGDLTIERAHYVNGGEIHVAGDVTTGDSTVYGTGVFVLDGAGDQTLGANGGTGEISNLTIDKDTGTLTLADHVQISGDLTHVSGTVDAGDSTVEFQGRNMTIAAGDITFNDVVIENGGTITLEGNLDVDGDLTIERAHYVNGGEIHVAGDVTTGDSTVYGTGVFVLDGAGDQTLGANGGTGEISNLTIDKDTGTLTLADHVQISGDLTHVSGTVDAGDSTVEFQGRNMTIAAGDITFNDVVIENGGTITLEGNLDVDGDLTIERAHYVNGGEMHVAGDVTTGDSTVYGTGVFVLDGAGDQTLGANGGTGEISNLTIDKDTGTLTLADHVQISGDLTHVSGTVDAGDSTVEFQGRNMTIAAGDITFNDVVIENGGTITLEGNLDVDGDLTIERAHYVNGGEMHVAGDVTTGDSTVYGTGVFVLDGAGDQTLGANGGTGEISNLTIDKAAGTLTLADHVQVSGDLTHVAGDVDAGESTVEFQGGNITLRPGDIEFHDVVIDNGSTITIDGALDVNGDLTLERVHYLQGGDIQVAGDLTTGDSTVYGSATFVLDGAGDQTLGANGGTGEVSNLTIDKAAGTLTLADHVQVSGDLTHVAGDVDAGESTVEFQGGNITLSPGDIEFHDVVIDNGSTITIDGTLEVQGDLTIERVHYVNGSEIRVAGDLTTSDSTQYGDASFVLVGDSATVQMAGDADTLSFDDVTPGAIYQVSGSGGFDTLDLSQYSASQVSDDGSTLVVDMGEGESFTVEYSSIEEILLNEAPEVSAGGDQVVEEGQLVTLQGAATDAQDQDLQYTWIQTSGPSVVLSDPHATEPTFTAPEGLSSSSITFELQVSYGENTSVDTVAVAVSADNDAPSADAGLQQAVEEGDTVTLAGSGTDPEGQGLSYTWVQTGGPTVVLSDPHAAEPTFTAPEGLSNSSITFELQVSDGESTSVDTVAVAVSADNDAPSADAGLQQAVEEGDTVTLAGSGTDPEGQGLSYTWVQTGGPTVVLSDPHAAEPTFTAPEGLSNSSITFELQVSDGTSTSVDTVAVTVHADDDAPVADAGPPQAAEEGQRVTLLGAGSDAEGQNLGYTWVQTSGPSVTLDDPHATEPSFDAPEGLSNSTITFELHVSDGTSTSVDTVDVLVSANDDAPVADAGYALRSLGGELVQLGGSGSDQDSDGLGYTWVQVDGPPVELSDPHAVDPTFTAPNGFDGTVLFELQVSDGTNTSVDTVEVQLVAAPGAVELAAPVEAEAPAPAAVSEGPPPVVLDPDEVVGSVDVVEQEVDADLLRQILPAEAEVDALPAETQSDGQDLSPLFRQVVGFDGAPSAAEETDLRELTDELSGQDFDDVFEEVAEVGQGARGVEASIVETEATRVAATEGEGETAPGEGSEQRSGFLASLWAAVRGRVDGSEKHSQSQSTDPNKSQQRRS